MRKIIFTNQKGGVGKTTLTREIGFYLAGTGKKVLLADCDPQGNLTKGLVTGDPAGFFYDAFDGGRLSLTPVTGNITLLAGDIRLSLLEKRLLGEVDAYTRMQELFEAEECGGYDYLLLDTPPSLGILTVNALSCADYFVIPVNPSLYSMQGTNDLLSTVSKVRKSLNPELSLLAVVLNSFDAVPVITRQIRDEIASSFGDVLCSAYLSKTIRIEEAIAKRTGVTTMQGSSWARVAGEVSSIGEELVSRIEAAAGMTA